MYHPSREPPGYREWMRAQGPRPIIEPRALRGEGDWIAAGQRVFEELDDPGSRTADPEVIAHFSSAEAIDRYRDEHHDVIDARGVILDYRIPALRGLWYRGLLEHEGSIGSLEEWFDPGRLRDDHVPGGFRGRGVTHRAVPGHRFGLDLAPDDKQALIAFLRTL